MLSAKATATMMSQENLRVKIQESANNAQSAGVPYNIHQNNRVSAALLTRVGYNVFRFDMSDFEYIQLPALCINDRILTLALSKTHLLEPSG